MVYVKHYMYVLSMIFTNEIKSV